MRKFLLFILLIVLSVALVYKSPFSALYNYNKAKSLYDSGKFEQSLPYFEKSLFADKKGIQTRYYYVMALSKSEPTYSVQKKLYEMANSSIVDEASKLAKIQSAALRYKLIDGIDNNYIYNASMGNDILHWDIKSFPLKVYIQNDTTVPDYYYPSIKTAFSRWCERTNFVKFKYADSEEDANIIVKFEDIPDNVCSGNICSFSVAQTEPDINKDKILRKMNLTFYKTNPLKQNFTNLEIFNTALHEIGHTLGLMGHSDNPNDIMFAQKNAETLNSVYSAYQALSMRDLRTLALLYRIAPTISDVKTTNNKNLYYAPLIIGSEEVRLQRKLEEYRIYVKNYPEIASGYINLSSVYSDLGDFKSALEILDKGERFANSTDEKFLVTYNRAVIFFNSQNYEKALSYAKNAKAIKNDKAADELIIEIEQKLSK